jgi:hypothetical protein
VYGPAWVTLLIGAISVLLAIAVLLVAVLALMGLVHGASTCRRRGALIPLRVSVHARHTAAPRERVGRYS